MRTLYTLDPLTYRTFHGPFCMAGSSLASTRCFFAKAWMGDRCSGSWPDWKKCLKWKGIIWWQVESPRKRNWWLFPNHNTITCLLVGILFKHWLYLFSRFPGGTMGKRLGDESLKNRIKKVVKDSNRLPFIQNPQKTPTNKRDLQRFWMMNGLRHLKAPAATRFTFNSVLKL